MLNMTGHLQILSHMMSSFVFFLDLIYFPTLQVQECDIFWRETQVLKNS